MKTYIFMWRSPYDATDSPRRQEEVLAENNVQAWIFFHKMHPNAECVRLHAAIDD